MRKPTVSTSTEIVLTTMTGTDYQLFGDTRPLAPRKGFVDALQDRFRVRGTNAGICVREEHQRTSYFFRPQAKVTIRPFRKTVSLIFDPADLLKTEVGPPVGSEPSIYADSGGPLIDYFHSREFKNRVRAGRRRGWMF